MEWLKRLLIGLDAKKNKKQNTNRLDFKYFTLAQPDPIEQVCTQDTFTVSGAANPVPAICGDNTGQHSTWSDASFHLLKKTQPWGS